MDADKVVTEHTSGCKMDTGGNSGGDGCLICNQSIKTGGRGGAFRSSSGSSPFLARDMNVYFVLKHLLELPSEQLECFLRYSPHSPGKWVTICGRCNENYVYKCKRLFGELMEVKRRFNVARRELIEVVKKSSDGMKNLVKLEEAGVKEPFILDIWMEIRKFVAKNNYGKYSVVDPFIAGDFTANDKLTAIQNSGEAIQGSSSLYHQFNPSNCKQFSQTFNDQGERKEDIKLEGLCGLSETERIIDDDDHGRKSVKHEPIWASSNEEIDHHAGLYDHCEYRRGEGSNDSDDTWDSKSNSSFAMEQDLREDEEKIKSTKPLPQQTVVKRKRGRPKKTVGPTKKRVFQCSQCQRKFIVKSSYLNHLGSEHGIKELLKFSCTFEGCGKSFCKKSQLLDHEDIHKDAQHECQTCGLVFQRKRSLYRHLETHKVQEVQPFQCDLCPARYKRKDHLKAHLKIIHGGGAIGRDTDEKSQAGTMNKTTKRTKGWHARKHVKCSECGLTFAFRKVLQFHMKKMHGPLANHPKPVEIIEEKEHQPKAGKCVKPKVELKCDQCTDKVFNTERKLRRHQIQVHKTNFYTCEKCDWTTSSSCNLPDHMKRHHGDEQDLKDLTCPTCEKVFSYEKKLREHIIRYHENPIEKFVCEHCGRELADKIGYLNHLGTAHGIKDGLRFTCSFEGCGRAFYKKSQLVYHEGAHSRRHQCHICGKKLTRDFQLKRHLKLHELNKNRSPTKN